MSPDFRSAPMESREGEGRARLAYAKAVGKRSTYQGRKLSPTAAMGRQRLEDALGFWLLWHIHGGFEGLERIGMHRATIFRKLSRFRSGFGEHPDVFELPGVTIDVNEYWTQAETAEERRRAAVAALRSVQDE